MTGLARERIVCYPRITADLVTSFPFDMLSIWLRDVSVSLAE